MIFDFEMSAQEAIEKWDRGEALWSIELGGLGPGYEQCIHVAAIEILRAALASPLGEDLKVPKNFQAVADQAIHYHNEALGGLSGAQAGMATQLAFKAYQFGWRGMLKTAQDQGIDDSRFIQVSYSWPRAKGRPAETKISEGK